MIEGRVTDSGGTDYASAFAAFERRIPSSVRLVLSISCGRVTMADTTPQGRSISTTPAGGFIPTPRCAGT